MWRQRMSEPKKEIALLAMAACMAGERLPVVRKGGVGELHAQETKAYIVSGRVVSTKRTNKGAWYVQQAKTRPFLCAGGRDTTTTIHMQGLFRHQNFKKKWWLEQWIAGSYSYRPSGCGLLKMEIKRGGGEVILATIYHRSNPSF